MHKLKFTRLLRRSYKEPIMLLLKALKPKNFLSRTILQLSRWHKRLWLREQTWSPRIGTTSTQRPCTFPKKRFKSLEKFTLTHKKSYSLTPRYVLFASCLRFAFRLLLFSSIVTLYKVQVAIAVHPLF